MMTANWQSTRNGSQVLYFPFFIFGVFRALLIEAAKSPFSNPPFELGLLLQRPVFTLIENGFCYRSDPKPAARFRNAAGLGVVVSSKSHGTLRREATRQHTTYTLSPRKTRTDTHHSRALDSPLDLANIHTTVFV